MSDGSLSLRAKIACWVLGSTVAGLAMGAPPSGILTMMVIVVAIGLVMHKREPVCPKRIDDEDEALREPTLRERARELRNRPGAVVSSGSMRLIKGNQNRFSLKPFKPKVRK